MSKIGMTMMLANRNRSNRGGNQESQMQNEMQNNNGNMRNEMRGGYGMESNYGRSEMEVGGMESRFRDRRGREHYDNGRFAPMRNEMESHHWPPPYYDVDINRYEYKPEGNYRSEMRGGRGGDRQARNEMEMGWDPYMESGRSEMRGGSGMRGGGEMRMIGFNREENEMRMGSDASLPRYQEMDRMKGNEAMKGGASSHGAPMFDEQTAKEWTSMMKNEDGTKGPHWTIEQAKKVMEQRGLRCDPYEFWAVLNAIYSDDVAVAKKYGVNKMDYYVDRAVAWLDDKDAQEGKAARYFHHVVKH